MALPGVRTNIKDRFYTLALQNNAADAVRVVAIARRSNAESEGALNFHPYNPISEDQVINAFGDGSELHRAYVELASTGTPRISLIALPGNLSDGALITSDIVDKIFEAAEPARPGVLVFWGRGGHPTDWLAGATPQTHTVPNIGFHADMGGALFLKAIVDNCKAISDRSRPVFAVMGVKPYLGDVDGEDATPVDSTAYRTMVASEVSAHLALSSLPDHESGVIGDNGSYLSVIATELRPARYPDEWGYANGAASYAGYLSSLPAEIAPTGKQLFNIEQGGLRYSPSRVQQEALIEKGVVPLAYNFSGQPVIVDGLTFGRSTSDYTRLTTLRIVFDTVQLVRLQAQNFVGQPYTVHTENALDTAISSALRSMIINGALLDAQFAITPSRRENKVTIDLVLLPAFEIHNIDVSVSVQL